MNKGLQWTIGISVGLIALAIAAATVLPLFLPNAGWSGYGMMGPMFGGRPMMSGGPMGYGMPFFGWLMLLPSLLVGGLIVAGVVWLMRMSAPPAGNAHCIDCGRPLQAGWKACPYCGAKAQSA